MDGNYIHPTAIVMPTAVIGRGNYIGPFCFIGDNVILGNDNRLEMAVAIGTPPESRDHWDDCRHGVHIGDRNIIREFVTVNAGTRQPTRIGSDCILLTKSHVGHDSAIHDRVTISCGVLIGGHSIIFRGANFGLNAACHQFSVIPHYAMIGMGAVITRTAQMETFGKYAGIPARKIGLNVKAFTEENRTFEAQEAMKKEYDNAR